MTKWLRCLPSLSHYYTPHSHQFGQAPSLYKVACFCALEYQTFLQSFNVSSASKKSVCNLLSMILSCTLCFHMFLYLHPSLLLFSKLWNWIHNLHLKWTSMLVLLCVTILLVSNNYNHQTSTVFTFFLLIPISLLIWKQQHYGTL
jgi:hypothetical protein